MTGRSRSDRDLATTEIPLVTFSGYLKQIQVAHLGNNERIILDRALPHFLPSDPTIDTERVREAYPEVTESQFSQILSNVKAQREPNRRFSGGAGLPRQRYYTLLRDEGGDDHLTLLAEMRSYRSCRKGTL